MRLRFSIRDLLWLTLVVAVALGWWLREGQLHAEAERLAKEVEKWRIKSYLERGSLRRYEKDASPAAASGSPANPSN